MAGPLVTVRGEATLEAPPDLAGLAVTLHRTGDSATAVREALAAGSAEVTAVLGQHRPAIEESSTTSVQVAPVFAARGRRVTGYRGTWSASLSVADLDALNPLVEGLTQLDQVQVDGPWWSLRTDSPLPREARLAAIADGRRRAEDYAAAFGATLLELVEVSDADGAGFGGPRRFARAMAASAESAPLDLEPTVQSVTGSVTLRFTMSAVVLDASP